MSFVPCIARAMVLFTDEACVRIGYLRFRLLLWAPCSCVSQMQPRLSTRAEVSYSCASIPSFFTIFLQSLTHVLLSAILFSALTTMAEIPALFSQRPIILRHFKAAMYHPWAESLALTLVDVPITFFQLTFFNIIIYFLVGLQQTAGQFL